MFKKKKVFPKHVDTHSALLDFILTMWFDYLTEVDGSKLNARKWEQ